MSFNRSRSDKGEYQNRKTGRSDSFNRSSGDGGGGSSYGRGGRGAASQYSGNRSFKKYTYNAQGGLQQQPRVGVSGSVGSSSSSEHSGASAQRSVHNVAGNQPPQTRGAPNAQFASVIAKRTEQLTGQGSTRPVVKAPSPPSSSVGSSDTAMPKTPVENAGEALQGFQLQFGMISPGCVNEMQIPARTSSTPPNLDEQKHDQARNAALKTAPVLPPSLPRHQLIRKDAGVIDQSDYGGGPQSTFRVKKDYQGSAAPSMPPPAANPGQIPPSLTISGIPMHMPYAPGPQLQSQGMAAPSHPVHMHMPMPMGIAQMAQQVFIPGLQPHPMQSQGINYQGQSLTYANQIGQLPHQLGSMGFSPQYAQKQGEKYSGGQTQRKTVVKITDPKTHEELQFDKLIDSHPDGVSSGSKAHFNPSSQFQPITSFLTTNPPNYYSSSYSPNMYHAPPSSLPAPTSEITPNSQAPRLSYLVNQASQNLSNNSSSRSTKDAKNAGTSVDNARGAINVSGEVSSATFETNGKPNSEPKRPSSRGKKKRKKNLQRANAQGTNADLYMAYKGSEEKKEESASLQAEHASCSIRAEHKPVDALPNIVAREKVVQSKAVPDDWEDAADISSFDLENSGKIPVLGDSTCDGRNVDETMAKKYSRDFLLKFAEQFTSLPESFQVTTDVVGTLLSSNVNISHLVDVGSYSNPVCVMGRQSGGSSAALKTNGKLNSERKRPKSRQKKKRKEFLQRADAQGKNADLYMAYKGPEEEKEESASLQAENGSCNSDAGGILSGPSHFAGGILSGPSHFAGGILSGPVPNLGPYAHLQRNNSDADRWQRGVNFQQKGLLPSPYTLLQAMHRAEKKYQVSKVTDEEEAKQRQLKGTLNELTPQNFEKLFEQVEAVNIDNVVTLTGFVSQIFDKAVMEPTFCEMYANFCSHLAGELPDFSEENEKITFKRLLLNKCHEEFERREREQEEANKSDEGGETKLTEEEREERRDKARRRMLGNIRLIGELCKKKMLTQRIMHECIKKLLGLSEVPDEEDIESLCILMTTIGGMIDHPKAKVHMDAYFERMTMLSNNMQLSSRLRFMLKYVIDLRKNRWQERRKVEGPKKIDEVHRDAAQERHLQSSRLTCDAGVCNSARRGPSMDFGSRGPALSSPGIQMSGIRGLSPQVRGFGAQDARFEDRHTLEARTLSVPLHQRLMGDESITLGRQGGLARGMDSGIWTSLMSSSPLSGISSIPGDSRRSGPGFNGFSSVLDRAQFGTREDLGPRFIQDRYASEAAQESNMSYSNWQNSGSSSDRTVPSAPTVQGGHPAFVENAWPEERLQNMSMAAIKEFYSARDEKEVALCVKDMNSPGFHPSMVSLWVMDSFERKDMERDLLAKLLLSLTRSPDGALSRVQLVKGFEFVLSTLEDAVTDAPKAPEFLGRLFAEVVLENVVSLNEIGQLLHEGGEEPGSLREAGLAADVLGSTLESIKLEKGESLLNEIRGSSNLRLEDFRPEDSSRSRKLELFI